MGNRAIRLTEQELRKLCEDAVDAGVAKYITEQERAAKKRRDGLLHNTKVLLENYQKFKAYIERSVKTLEDVEGVELSERDMDIMRIFGIREDDRKIRSVQRSVTTMTLLMAHVDRMLEVYRVSCEGSPSEVERRKWAVIERMYLRENRMTTNQIAEEFKVDLRAIQYDAKQARDDIQVLLFGIEAILDNLT